MPLRGWSTISSRFITPNARTSGNTGASIFIFVMVIAAVGLGLWMSFLHFYEGRKGGGGRMKVSRDGVEVSSPVIGLMILVVSLAFFYLYLTQVYPITEISR